MFSVFIKFLLADSSRMLLVSIWFGKLLFPLHVSHQSNSMHPSRHWKLWDHSSGSNPNSNRLRGITGPSQAQLEYERDCYWVPGGQHYAGGCLVYCPPVWSPAWPLMLRSHKSSNNFFTLCFVSFSFSNLKQKPRPLPLQLGKPTAMSSFFALYWNSLWPYWKALGYTGGGNWQKKWWLHNWGLTDKTCPLWGCLWPPSSQRIIACPVPGDPVILCIPLCYLFVHPFLHFAVTSEDRDGLTHL